MLGAMQAVNDAELRGDADGALRIMAANLCGSDGRVFWNPERMGRLLQLVHLGALVPGWATSRWILEQALVQLDPSLREQRDQAMAIAIELRGGPRRLIGADAIDARVKVMDHDWVHRQLLLYEYGGLARFLEAHATPDLVVGADRVGAWCDAPVRPLRLEAREPSVLCWTDLASGEELVVPNLGAAVLEQAGEHALARLVPTEVGPMFDGVPLGVSEQTARAVADDPGEWLSALRPIAGTEDYFPDLVHGNFLLTDVPSRIALLALQDLVQPGSAPLHEADLAREAVRLARSTASRPSSSLLDPWPCVAWHLLAPETLPYLIDHVGPEDEGWLARLAEVLHAPADQVCLRLGAAVADAA